MHLIIHAVAKVLLACTLDTTTTQLIIHLNQIDKGFTVKKPLKVYVHMKNYFLILTAICKSLSKIFTEEIHYENFFNGELVSITKLH